MAWLALILAAVAACAFEVGGYALGAGRRGVEIYRLSGAALAAAALLAARAA